jgi:hypothetical protein
MRLVRDGVPGMTIPFRAAGRDSAWRSADRARAFLDQRCLFEAARHARTKAVRVPAERVLALRDSTGVRPPTWP